ncbi:MAG: hypothetical protein HFI86_06600 [Bacilli bacterium]|nr:hypothetical protein [Bacilli bacterium]
MNKKQKNLIRISIVTTFVLLIGIFTVNAGANKKQTIYNENNIGYTVKSIYDKQEDGWLYGFEIAYVNGSSNVNYIFDGYNLKYIPTNTDYYISYKDMETGEEIKRIPSRYATLSTSAIYRYDIKKINEFFNLKKFNKSITIDDLSELNIDNIDKEYLVDLFNRTINSEIKTTPGEYVNIPSLDWKKQESTDEQNPGEWQVMYITDYGYIYDIEIEFINNDKNYLSDSLSKNSRSNADTELLEEIENLEDSIIKNQGISLEELKKNNDVLGNNPDLNNLLDSLNQEIFNK